MIWKFRSHKSNGRAELIIDGEKYKNPHGFYQINANNNIDIMISNRKIDIVNSPNNKKKSRGFKAEIYEKRRKRILLNCFSKHSNLDTLNRIAHMPLQTQNVTNFGAQLFLGDNAFTSPQDTTRQIDELTKSENGKNR
ncbi:4618_t:CDS:2 [Funneliformis mosseae]|uniref:4618_t:CDS:1 n=1 Tax=Funneliformis mosseae TaxID=27381 RepID=A0A9N9FX84_FUNMO|nr:4618_t:CDS:2 [Funneliformis mosseae]